MNGREVKAKLEKRLIETSGLEARRPYLGMSGINSCQRQLYYNYITDKDMTDQQAHWYCWTGYLHEAAIISLLGGKPNGKPIEVIAEFDARFRGHVDYVIDGNLVEIKSVGWEKFCRIKRDNRPTWPNKDQVQMYLRHGGWDKCHLIYVARDVPHQEWRGMPFWSFDIHPYKERADMLDAKAKRVLAAIDADEPPKCECGRCKY